MISIRDSLGELSPFILFQNGKKMMETFEIGFRGLMKMKRDENMILFGLAGLIISYILYINGRILLSALAFTATVIIGLIWGALYLRKKNMS